MALSFRTRLSLGKQRPSVACTAAVPTTRRERCMSVVVRAAAEPALPVASRRAAVAMGACGALLNVAPAWSKEQQLPDDNLPADTDGTDQPTLPPDDMQKISFFDALMIAMGRGTGGKGGTNNVVAPTR